MSRPPAGGTGGLSKFARELKSLRPRVSDGDLSFASSSFRRVALGAAMPNDFSFGFFGFNVHRWLLRCLTFDMSGSRRQAARNGK